MKNFTIEGNLYKLKPQWGMNIPLIGAFIILTIVGFAKIPESSFKWWMLGISILLLISVLSSYLIINLDQKEIRTKIGFFGRARIISLESLEDFTVLKTKHYGILTINVKLLANYVNSKGKDKTTVLAQAFFARPIQHILNDVNEILGDEYQRQTEI
ncbi:hypothetical protein IW15_22200 [Chryseobacterium soli]|uniref:DUF304 domain-containing protein n=1 Tax=Chryseobacterium soli TaxID=445961 RepID=A0A085ZZB0_9FLAO|nr:hypothetical protein [Chryseobacterium soli]KFF09774.1 hypothetical protein IW15_22200 [Chryseobacterium soli]